MSYLELGTGIVMGKPVQDDGAANEISTFGSKLQ
jgi:hypothetical protein